MLVFVVLPLFPLALIRKMLFTSEVCKNHTIVVGSECASGASPRSLSMLLNAHIEMTWWECSWAVSSMSCAPALKVVCGHRMYRFFILHFFWSEQAAEGACHSLTSWLLNSCILCSLCYMLVILETALHWPLRGKSGHWVFLCHDGRVPVVEDLVSTLHRCVPVLLELSYH